MTYSYSKQNFFLFNNAFETHNNGHKHVVIEITDTVRVKVHVIPIIYSNSKVMALQYTPYKIYLI